MRFNHEEIRERLPEYIKSGQVPDWVKNHIMECSECKMDFSMLLELHKVPVPESGEMFFETLPQKVVASLNKKRSFFWRLIPALSIITLFIIAGSIYYLLRTSPENGALLFTDPLSYQIHDLSILSEDEIPLITIGEIKEDEIYLSGETHLFEELVYLSAGELEELSKALETKKEKGGVL
jgi:hypothetical protein